MLGYYKRNVSKATIVLLALVFYYVYCSLNEFTNEMFVYGTNMKSVGDDQIKDFMKKKQEVSKDYPSFNNNNNNILPFFLKGNTFLRNENTTRSVWIFEPSNIFFLNNPLILKTIQSTLFLETFMYFGVSVALSYLIYNTHFGESWNKNVNISPLESIHTRSMVYPQVINHSGFLSPKFHFKHDDLEMKLMKNVSSSESYFIWGHVAKKHFLYLFLLANICRFLINALLLQRSFTLLKSNYKNNLTILQFLVNADHINNIPTLIFLLSYNVVIVFLTQLCYLGRPSIMHTIAGISQTIVIIVTLLYPIHALLTYYNIISYYGKYVSLIMSAIHFTTSFLLLFLGSKISLYLQKEAQSVLKSSILQSLSYKIILFTALISFFLLLRSCVFLWLFKVAFNFNAISFLPFLLNHMVYLFVEAVPNLLIFKLMTQKTSYEKDELN